MPNNVAVRSLDVVVTLTLIVLTTTVVLLALYVHKVDQAVHSQCEMADILCDMSKERTATVAELEAVADVTIAALRKNSDTLKMVSEAVVELQRTLVVDPDTTEAFLDAYEKFADIESTDKEPNQTE